MAASIIVRLFRALRSVLRPCTRPGGDAADLIGRIALTQSVVVLAFILGAGCERQTPAPPSGESIGIGAIDASLDAAEQYLTAGNTASAESIIVTLLKKAPQDHRAHELYGRVLYLRSFEAAGFGDDAAASRHVAEAYEHYRRAVESAEIGGGNPLTLAGLHQSAGEIASAAGRPRDALKHFRAAGRLEPGNPKPPLYEAQILIQLDRAEEAGTALHRVLQLDPDEAYAHASLAALAVRAGKHEAAVDHIAEARRLDPDNLPLRLQESRIRRESGDPRRALELLVALDDRTRAEEAVTAEIARCYTGLGDPAGAAAAWEHRYRSHPRDPSAWRAVVRAAHARIRAGERDRAIFLYEKARLIAPDEIEVRELGQEIQENRQP